ncbi:hypothetical protein ACIA8F_38700 [Streptomyces sp. NPDC051563]|uniref:hypothetical protein n=1 Tax=Streptomyces sp. NPDC051563 TaxID=3365659 RepID=UPI0037AB8321
MTALDYTLILKDIEAQAHALAVSLEKLKDAPEPVKVQARTVSRFVIETYSTFAGER